MNIQEITRKLLDLNFSIRSKGFDYWVYALDIKLSKPELKTMSIYNTTSNVFNKTSSQIERAMRTSLKPAKTKIQKKYKYDIDLSISSVIEIISKDLKGEM